MDVRDVLIEETAAFGELIRDADPATPVPTCPDWTMQQLFKHVGRGNRWAAKIIADRRDTALDPREVPDGRPPDDMDAAIEWLNSSAQLVLDSVDDAGAETEVWTFVGPRPAQWWIRRRLHEATVHRADAAIALGTDFELTPEVAADGIGEWLERVAIEATAESSPLNAGQTLHLHATDPELGAAGEWTITGTGSGSRGRTSMARATRPCAGAHRTYCWPLSAARPPPKEVSRFSATTPYGTGGWTALPSEWRTFCTMTTSEIATVLAWHDALNAKDFDTLLQVSSDDIEFGDANGAGQGHEALREWATSLGVTAADPGRMYVRDGVVVAEEQDGDAVAFRVVRDHVTSVFRHVDLASALAATELTEDDLTS